MTRYDEGPRRFAELEFASLSRSASQDVSHIRELLGTYREPMVACAIITGLKNHMLQS
jgi:hypothetical protein